MTARTNQSAGLRRRDRRNRRGSAMVELALSGPLMFLLLAGAIDVGRVFYTGITLASAALAGIQYGLSSPAAADDLAGMQTKALADAVDIPGASATATVKCYCIAASGARTEVTCSTTSCAGGGTPAKYVTVKAFKQFRTVIPYPLLPGTINVSQVASVRVK